MYDTVRKLVDLLGQCVVMESWLSVRKLMDK